MDGLQEKLAHCFSLAFPDLPAAEISTASAESIPGWDSMAQVTLLSLIGEEFGIDIDFEAFEGATSFQSIVERLKEMGVDG